MEAEDSAEDLAAYETGHGGDTPHFYEANFVEEPAAEPVHLQRPHPADKEHPRDGDKGVAGAAG